MDKSLKDMYREKRLREAVRADIDPINEKEFNVDCNLYNDDKLLIMSLQLYAGSRDEAERMAKHFKSHSTDIYSGVLDLFNEK